MSGLANARTIAASALIAVALYVSGLLVMLTPLPILYASVARGRLSGALTALIACTAVAALYLVAIPMGGATVPAAISWLPLPGTGLEQFFSTIFLRAMGVGYFGFYAVAAIALAEGVRRRWELTRWGATALIAGLAVIAAVAAWGYLAAHQPLLENTRTFLLTAITQVVEANRAAGNEGAQIAFLADRSEEVAGAVTGLLPAIVFTMALFAVAVNIVVGRRLIRGKHAFHHVHNLARFRLPDLVIWGLIVAGALFFADRYALHTGRLAIAAENGLIVFGAIYFLQGMAVIVYMLQGVRAPIMRMLAYVAMLIFIQTVSLALVVVGVADVWVDFRARRWKALHHKEG